MEITDKMEEDQRLRDEPCLLMILAICIAGSFGWTFGFSEFR